MAAWITDYQVGVLLQTDLSADSYVAGLITHAQALAEAEIGEQTTITTPDDADPINAIQAVLAQIVARMWQAGKNAQGNPGGFSMEQTGPFAVQSPNAGAAGLGLTNREIKALRRAAGLLPVGILPTTRGDLETPAVVDRYGIGATVADEETYTGLLGLFGDE